MSIIYQSDTSPMYVGRLNPNIMPLWLQSIEDNQWGVIPLTNKISEIDPEDDVLINPNHPGSAPWHAVGGLPLMMSAWCGACYDEVNDILYYPLSGGHADYAGNEPYKQDISVDAPTSVMLRNPSGAIGNEGTLDDGLEATGDYFDGRPRSVHSYNKNVFVNGLGPMVVQQGNTSWSGQAGTSRGILVDPITGEHTYYSASPDQNSSGTCYDPSRNAVWMRGRGTCAMWTLDLTLDSWAQRGSSILGTTGTALVYLPESDCIFLVSSVYTNGFAIFDCVTNIYHEPAISGSFVGMNMTASCQPVLTDKGYIALWDNSTDTTIINTLTVPADPRVDNWVVGQLSVDGGNSVIPSVKQGNGTFGRFFYSKNLNGFGVINNTNEDIYFFKLGA